MRAGGEGEMAVRAARDVEPLGIGELPSGRGWRPPMPSVTSWPGPMLDAADLGLARRAAVAELVGAFEAQELLDRGADQVGRVDQPAALAGPCAERRQRVADQVGRGLVAGVEQEDAVVDQLLRAQPLLALARQQARQHVAGGIAGAACAARR